MRSDLERFLGTRNSNRKYRQLNSSEELYLLTPCTQWLIIL